MGFIETESFGNEIVLVWLAQPISRGGIVDYLEYIILCFNFQVVFKEYVNDYLEA